MGNAERSVSKQGHLQPRLPHGQVTKHTTVKWPIIGICLLEFIITERVQVNPDNSRAMSVLTFLLFKLNTLQTRNVKL